MLTSCTSLSPTEKSSAVATPHIIYFLYHNWHTSLLIDAATLARLSEHLKQEAQGQQYIRIGWGDGDYFTGKSKNRWTATKALFVSRYSALQVLPYDQPPFVDELPSGTWVPLVITEAGMQNLVNYLDASLALDKNNHTIPLQAYAANTGNFYQARPRYSVLTNCNTWSAKALEIAGLPIKSSLRLTAQSVFAQAQSLSESQVSLGMLVEAEFQIAQ